jgi:hypothetical protein
MSTISTISISGIPNILASDFEGKLYLDNRIQKYPDSKFKIIETKESYCTIDNPNFTSTQFIQNTFYPKYKATIYINENIDIDKVKFANNVVFTLSDEREINAKIIDIKNTALSDTSIFKCEIDFYQKNIDSESIINYLTYPECLEPNFVTAQMHRLTLTNNYNIDNEIDFESGDNVTFYTKLNPIYSRSDLEFKPDKNIGIDYIYRSSDFGTVNATFYLTEAEIIKLKKYLPRCFYLSGGISYGTKFIDGVTELEYTAIEAIVPKIQTNDDLIKIYEFKLMLKYSQIDYNHFQ